MSANETMHTSPTGARKAGNLERYDLIPVRPLACLAWAYEQADKGEFVHSFSDLNTDLWAWWIGASDNYFPRPAGGLPHISGLAPVAWNVFEELHVRYGDDVQVDPDTTIGEHAWRYDRIPPEPLRMLAEHYGRGALKYADNNWRKGYDWRLSFAALNRHLWQDRAGEEIDAETGSPHLVAVAWHVFTLIEFEIIHPEFDTRLKTIDERALRAVSV